MPKIKDENVPPSNGATPRVGNFNFSSSLISTAGSSGLVNIHKRKIPQSKNPVKKQKITVIPNPGVETPLKTSIADFILMVECFSIDFHFLSML